MNGANVAQIQSRPATAEPQEPITEFIGVREVSRISGFSKSSIRRMQQRKAFPLPVIAEGNLVRYDRAEILQWRAECFLKREQREAGK